MSVRQRRWPGRKCSGVPEAALTALGNPGQGLVAYPDALPFGYLAQGGRDLLQGDALELVALAARQDRGGDLVGLRGGEDEDDVGRRLLERLQKRVEGLLGEHVDFVDDVDLVARRRGGEFHVLPELADLVDAPVGRPVDLADVHGAAFRDLPAVRAGVAGDLGGALLAVEGLGQDAGHRGFSTPRGPLKMKAWATRPRRIALRRVVTT